MAEQFYCGAPLPGLVDWNEYVEDEVKNVCGEIMYDDVHSDICMTHDGEYVVTKDYREFLHACLDEWLDKSNGTGMFWIGDPKFAVENFREDFRP